VTISISVVVTEVCLFLLKHYYYYYYYYCLTVSDLWARILGDSHVGMHTLYGLFYSDQTRRDKLPT